MARQRRLPAKLRGQFQIASEPGSTIFAEDGPMALFTAKDRKRLWLEGMWSVIQYWAGAFLGRRFSNYVKRSPFNYTGGDKNGDPRPLVQSGILKTSVGQGLTLKVTGTSKGSFGKISFPTQPYASGEINRVLETIPSWEADRMAEQMAATIEAMIEGSEQRGRTKLRLAESI